MDEVESVNTGEDSECTQEGKESALKPMLMKRTSAAATSENIEFDNKLAAVAEKEANV